MRINQIDIILQYLKIETNYAIIINGNYGIGKTHFYNNDLKSKIEEIYLPKNDKKKYMPIHISLFGLKNLEEIQTSIFLELYPILKDKKLNLTAGIVKSLIRGIAQLKQLGDIDKYIDDIKPKAKDWLDYNQLVICFDDLDRKSTSLNLQDIFGFINSLVENQGAKILIIANEKVLAEGNNNYSILKEKVVGVTIQYNPETLKVFNQIIKERYASSYKEYNKFIIENKEDILQAIEVNENNFRNLIYFLEHFKLIFYDLKNLMQINKDFAIREDEKLNAILHFTIAICIEFRLSS